MHVVQLEEVAAPVQLCLGDEIALLMLHAVGELAEAMFLLPCINAHTFVQDPATYDTAIVGLTAARALAGEAPVLTEEEKTHVEVGGPQRTARSFFAVIAMLLPLD